MRRHMSPDEAAVLGLMVIAVVIIAIFNFWFGIVSLGVLMVFACFSDRLFNR